MSRNYALPSGNSKTVSLTSNTLFTVNHQKKMEQGGIQSPYSIMIIQSEKSLVGQRFLEFFRQDRNHLEQVVYDAVVRLGENRCFGVFIDSDDDL